MFTDKGDLLRRQGLLAEAEAYYREQIERSPTRAASFLGLGLTLKDRGRVADALDAFTRAALMPDAPVEALIEAAVASAQLSRGADSARWMKRAVDNFPGRYEPHFFWGCMLVNQNRYEEAIVSLTRSLQINPSNPEATRPLIFALRKVGRFEDARTVAAKWMLTAPADPEPFAMLAQISREQNRFEEALEFAQQARARAPEVADWSLLVSRTLVELGKTDAAIEEIRRVADAHPNHLGVWIHLGSAYKIAGEFEKARWALGRASDLSPQDPSVLYELADITKFSAGDPLIGRMEQLSLKLDATPAGSPAVLHFALGKANEDIGRTDRAFVHFAAGNSLERKANRYDEAATLGAFDRVRQVFSPEFVARLSGGGVPSTLPVFFVGMPRSGSTLLEQILASHPAVSAAGEVTYLPQAVSQILAAPAGFGDNLEALTHDKLAAIARVYLTRLEHHSLARPRVTDKLLANALLVGVIHLAMPNAKIIHCVRDPVDTCLSCFTRSFGARMPFTNDLSTLGRYYRAHTALMAHWREVLPPDAFIDMRYEDVVGDLEGEARRLIAFCGLEWDDRCVRFHETSRAVNTSSMAQVREPLYSRSTGRWRKYETHLGPLIEALGDLVP